MKHKTSKTVLSATISLVVAIIVSISAVFAWFVQSTNAKIDDFMIGVVDLDTSPGVGLTFNGQQGLSVNMSMYPGDCYTIPFETLTGSFELLLDGLSVTMPQAASLSEIYSKVTTLCDYSYLADVQNNTWVRFNPLANLTNEQMEQYYEQFLQPISNAIELAVVEWDADTGASELSSAQLEALTYVPLTADTDVLAYGENYSFNSTPVEVENDGTKCYTLVIRYNAECYPAVTINGKQVRMDNSNVYMLQRISASLTLRTAS